MESEQFYFVDMQQKPALHYHSLSRANIKTKTKTKFINFLNFDDKSRLRLFCSISKEMEYRYVMRMECYPRNQRLPPMTDPQIKIRVHAMRYLRNSPPR